MKRIVYLLTLLLPLCAAAQQLPVHNQFFLNPYVLNPASVGQHGQTEVFLTQRQQMQGSANAPVTTSINLQIPSRGRTAFGVNVVDHRYGMLANTSTLATLGYAFKLGRDHFLRLGASGGMGKYTVDRNRLENEGDFSRIKSFNNKSFVDAHFGVSYQLKGLTLGVSAPPCLTRRLVNTNAADPLDFRPINYYLANAGYYLQLSPAFAVSPQVQYRYSTNFPSQYQAMGTLHFHNVWAGGGYRQNVGPVATAGAKIKNTFTLGYVYEPAASGAGTPQTTHEVLLSMSFGPKKTRKEEVAEAREIRQEEDNKKETKQSKEKAAKEKAAAKKLAARQAADEKAESKSEREKAKKEKTRTAKKEKAAKEKAKDQQAKEKKAAARKEKGEKARAKKARKAPKQSSRKPAAKAAPVQKLTAKPVEKPVTESVVAPAKEEERIEEHHRVHPLELKKGNYVVVGSFNVFDNAVRFTRTMYERGLRADYRYSSKTNRYYVFVYQSKNVDAARAEKDNTRQFLGIADAWVLIVE
jgi:type IX secretion system PorP/SprF family membrane protein